MGVALLALVAALTGCASETRMMSFGPLPGGDRLLTLIVSEDLDVVRNQCRQIQPQQRVLGCQTSKPVHIPGALSVRAMTIVRYAESLPSAVTFEIDAHELCHAVANLQLLPFDPCHDGNSGELQAMLTSARR
jgi:hypothetical protein